ncbi:hypothetical protein HF086_018016 [Spodoptera exigua]|nr:hypothetical protein HF086_018016 [Spodoptera exigua]
MNTSWSHHRLCDLQRQAARLHHSRPSIPDTTKYQRNMLRKSCSTQLTKPESSHSIDDGIILNFSRFGPCRDASLDSDCGSPGGCVITVSAECNMTSENQWQNSTVDISSNADDDLCRPPSCQG